MSDTDRIHMMRGTGTTRVNVNANGDPIPRVGMYRPDPGDFNEVSDGPSIIVSIALAALGVCVIFYAVHLALPTIK